MKKYCTRCKKLTEHGQRNASWICTRCGKTFDDTTPRYSQENDYDQSGIIDLQQGLLTGDFINLDGNPFTKF